MKTTASREVMIEKTSMETGVDIIRGVVGDMMTEERIRKFILGANGDVQIALNHALNFFEKKTGDTTPALQKLLEGLAEEVKCSICLGYLTQPVALQCLHTFCLDCIRGSVVTNLITCPLCRKGCTLDSRGAEGLKQNSCLANIIDKLRSSQATKLCGECHEVVCSIYCVECGTFMCEDCERKTHAKSTNRHNCKPFEDCYSKDNVFLKETMGKGGWTPEYAVSFKIKRESCEEILEQWLGDLWFAPFGLDRRAMLQDVTAVYLPYWQYDVSVAQGVVDELPTTLSSKSMLVLASREYEGYLVPVHHVIEDPLIPLTGQHTSNTRVARIDRSAQTAWLDLNHAESRSWNMSTLRARLVFMPAYHGTYLFKNNSYQFIICGSSGRCRGERPYSCSKLSLVTGLGAAISIFTSNRIANA